MKKPRLKWTPRSIGNPARWNCVGVGVWCIGLSIEDAYNAWKTNVEYMAKKCGLTFDDILHGKKPDSKRRLSANQKKWLGIK